MRGRIAQRRKPPGIFRPKREIGNRKPVSIQYEDLHLLNKLKKISSPTESPLPLYPPKPCLKRCRSPEEECTKTDTESEGEQDGIVPMEIDIQEVDFKHAPLVNL